MPHTTRILIVDDEPLMRMALEQALTDSGCEVIEATDAHSATETLAGSSPFDVVLLDYQMPDSGDLRLLAAVRSLSPASRVIMMTAHPTAEIVSGARALGAACVLNKPIDIDALCKLVRT